MAACMLQKYCRLLNRLSTQTTPCVKQQTRNVWRQIHRGKRPERSKTWKQRKAEIECVDPEVDPAVNIGYKKTKPTLIRTSNVAAQTMTPEEREQREEQMERKARHRTLRIPIDEIEEESFLGLGQQRVHRLAEYCGIFRDLFGGAFFYPMFPLDVGYQSEEPDMVDPVYFGNFFTPAQTRVAPHVSYAGQPDKKYTLCMTAPDSHLEEKNKEYIHWMVANIPGCDVSKGETVYSYLPIFPVHGTGHHRYVFTLYEHDADIAINNDGVSPDTTSLRERTFENLEFYRQHQEQMTPVSLCFFQAQWDETVRETFHNTLDMNEPRYEFYPPLEYVPKQLLWPLRKPFHCYMDMYRDVKDIGEEVLKEKLKLSDPFKGRVPKKRFPNLEPLDKEVPSWMRLKEVDKRSRQSYWKYLDD